MRTLLLAFSVFFLYRFGNFISVPYLMLDSDITGLMSTVTKTGVLNLQSLKRMSLFSLGIVPYITSGILIQLLKFVFSDSQYGLNLKDKNYSSKQTLLFTLVLSIFQSIMFVNFSSLGNTSLMENIVSVVFLVGGCFTTVWIAKIITSFGYGNGASILIMMSIVEYIFLSFSDVISGISNGQLSPIDFLSHFSYVILVLLLIVLIELAYRPLKLTFPSTKFRDGFHKGRKSDILPLKINNSGVLPLIFSMSFSALLSTVILPYFFQTYQVNLSFLISIVTLLLICFFIIFYTPFVINTEEISNNLKKSNVILENRRPGLVTKDYIDTVIKKLNYIAILYLSFMVVVPDFLQSQGVNVIVSGVSAVILVSVVIDLIRRIQHVNYSNKSKFSMN